MIKTIVSDNFIYGVNPTKIVLIEVEENDDGEFVVIRFDNPEIKNVVLEVKSSDDCGKIIDFLNNPNEMIYPI